MDVFETLIKEAETDKEQLNYFNWTLSAENRSRENSCFRLSADCASSEQWESIRRDTP